MILFETERLRVRQYTLEDEENFFLLNGDPEVVKYIRPAKSRQECDVFLREVMAAYKQFPAYGRWAAEDKQTGTFVGSFSILPIENSDLMHLGYALLPAYWGLGYATELTKGGIAYTFAQTPLSEIYAITEKGNTGSIQVLQKTGFVEESKYEDQAGKQMLRFVLSAKC